MPVSPIVRGVRVTGTSTRPSLEAAVAELDQTDSVADWLNRLLSASASGAVRTDGTSHPPAPAVPPVAELERKVQVHLVALGDMLVDAQVQTDSAMRRLRTSVPQIRYDVRLFQDTTARLDAKATALARSLRQPAQTDADNNDIRNTAPASESSFAPDVLDRLHRLSLLQERVSASRDVLRDAEAWSSLEGDVNAYLVEGKIEDAALRLSEATGSLAVFAQTAAYTQRQTIVTQLITRLVESLRPILQRAVGTSDITSASSIRHTLSLVGEEAAFERLWLDARALPLVDDWSRVYNTGGGVKESLARLYAACQTKVEEERVYASTLFPGTVRAHLAQFVITVLDALTPSISSRLANLAEESNEQALPVFLACWYTTESAVRTIGASLARSNETDEAANSTDQDSIPKWDAALYAPYQPYQEKFALLSRMYMAFSWGQETVFSSDFDPSKVQQQGERALLLVSEAVGNSNVFTRGFAIGSLLESADAFVGDCLDTLEAHLKRSFFFVVVDPSSADRLVRVAAHILAATKALFTRLVALEEECASSTSTLQHWVSSKDSDLTDARLEAQKALLAGGTRALLEQLESTGLDSPALHSHIQTLHTIDALGAMKHLYVLRSDIGLSGGQALLPIARAALLRLVQSAQSILLKAVQEPLATPMLVYASLPVWTSTEVKETDEGVSIPSFSLSPTETVAGLGEALLDLPRALEVYAQDASLAFGIHALPHLNLLADPDAPVPKPPGPVSTLDSSSVRRGMHERRASLLATPPPDGARSADPSERELGPGEVLSLWLLSILRSFLARLTGEILPGLPRLSAHGARQLATDLEYLESILAVLNYIEAGPDGLDAWRRAVSLDSAMGKALAQSPQSLDASQIGSLLPLRSTAAFSHVARLRGFGRMVPLA